VFGENSANFSKKTVTLFGKTPSVKSRKNSYFLYPWGALRLFSKRKERKKDWQPALGQDPLLGG